MIIKKKILLWRSIVFVVVAFVVAGVSFGVKEWRYYLTPTPLLKIGEGLKSSGALHHPSFIKEDKSSASPSFGTSLNPFPQNVGPFTLTTQSTSLQGRDTKKEDRGSLVGTGVVSDVNSQGKYVFEYKGDEYLLYSKKEYAIGDELRIVGNIQQNTHTDGFSYWKISSGTFDIPLFSGSFDFSKWMKMKGWKGSIYETNSITNYEGPITNGINISDGDEEYGFPIESQMTGMGDDKQILHPEGYPLLGQGGQKREGTNPSASGTSPGQGRNIDKNTIGFIKHMKKGIQEKVMEVYGKNRISGLLLGMLIGDKSQIPESEYQSFIDSGLVHLIAVSGGNILMIVVFLQFILFFLPFYIRLGVILCTIVGYSLICGLDSSVFRAVLMGGMSMVALFRGREVNIWRLMSISAILMLIINPYFLAYDTGFLLSYSALMGIVYFNTTGTRAEGQGTRTEELGPSTVYQVSTSRVPVPQVPKHIQYVYKNYIAPSIGASIGIFPIIIFFMGKINILGIVGNLFVLPIVPFVMIYGFVSVWIYQFLGREWILWIEKICIQYIYNISELLAQYGIYFMVSGLWVKYVVLLAFGVGI
ncbi:MAG TPA: ComEC/Rec2 family competence protein, partial [Candidatus Absconditabacterales bacterium]|nr:ComEC/Rec2 family competence protein [Candidatus Absconditabacterales bacterium]